MKITKNDVLFVFALLFALWFALTGIVWVYFAALFVAYPFGALSLVFWLTIRKDGKKRNIVLPIVLAFGLAASLSVLVYLLIYN